MIMKEKLKIAFIAGITALCCFFTYYVYKLIGRHVVITHLYYIPIILASYWWGRKGVFVSLFLGVFLIFYPHFRIPTRLHIFIGKCTINLFISLNSLPPALQERRYYVKSE